MNTFITIFVLMICKSTALRPPFYVKARALAPPYTPSSTAARHNRHRMAPLKLAAGNTEPPSSIPSSMTTKSIMAKVTNLFPLWVATSALLGLARPPILAWFDGPLIEAALCTTMVAMGSTLSVDDFKEVNPATILLGFVAQFTIMPLMAVVAAKVFSLPPAYAAGLILVGCCPGGTASNLVTLIANADVGLSVAMTSCSTAAAAVMTPLLASLLFAGTVVPINGAALVATTLRVVLLPVALGMALKVMVAYMIGAVFNCLQKANVSLAVTDGLPAPHSCTSRSSTDHVRWYCSSRPQFNQANHAPTHLFLHVHTHSTPMKLRLPGLVSLICGGIVAQNAGLMLAVGTGANTLALVGAVASMHATGFLFGYAAAAAFGLSTAGCRTVSIETGMQNSALGTVLALRALATPVAAVGAAAAVSSGSGLPASAVALPGAISATAHSVIGSALAGYWRYSDGKKLN